MIHEADEAVLENLEDILQQDSPVAGKNSPLWRRTPSLPKTVEWNERERAQANCLGKHLQLAQLNLYLSYF